MTPPAAAMSAARQRPMGALFPLHPRFRPATVIPLPAGIRMQLVLNRREVASRWNRIPRSMPSGMQIQLNSPSFTDLRSSTMREPRVPMSMTLPQRAALRLVQQYTLLAERLILTEARAPRSISRTKQRPAGKRTTRRMKLPALKSRQTVLPYSSFTTS